ncbi:hypothetical protein K488DRAFT_65362, partial [Vararia minispora EC-137]
MNRLPLPIEEARPPDWLPTAHASADLGLVGYYPSYPGQQEDVLTTAAVQGGLHIQDPVSAPTWGAKDMVIKSLTQDETLAQLEDLINNVFARRADAAAPIPAHSFRMPSRVTLNDAKRQSWLAALADPNVPLTKLSKSVPHGARGAELLDMLHGARIAVPRALWFLRVLGANETAGLRARPGYDPTAYCVEWAAVVTGHLKRQLAEIVLPSAPRPGVSIKQVFKGVLSDPDTRERWLSRFTYSLALLRAFYADGLVDARTFLAWLVTQLASANLAQAALLARLVDEYLDGLLACRALARPLVEACLARIAELRAAAPRDALAGLEGTLRHFVRRACLCIPDAFVSPRLYLAHSALLVDLLAPSSPSTHSPTSPSSPAPPPPLPPDTDPHSRRLASHFTDTTRRNSAMLFRNLPPRALAQLAGAVADISRLNALGFGTDLDASVPQLGEPSARLLAWAITPLQYGAHRPYAAATLLARWRERAERRYSAEARTTMQDVLFDFLDAQVGERDGEERRALAVLFGELVRRGLFSYEGYVQRLVARGERGVAIAEDPPSPHRAHLRWIPLDKAPPALANQRRALLYGTRVRAQDTPEERAERTMRREVRPLFPELFGGAGFVTATGSTAGTEECPAPRDSTAPLLASCTTLLSTPRFEQVRVIKGWLLPLLLRYFDGRLDDVMLVGTALRPFCMAVDLLERLQCYRSMFDLCMTVLAQPSTPDFLVILVETLRRYKDIWACMGTLKQLADALYAAHQTCKARSLHSRPLLNFLIEIDGSRYLDPGVRAAVDAEIASYAQALRPVAATPEPVPVHLQEILLLPTDTRHGAASVLASNLWYRYRTAPDWGWRVWDNTFASLRLKPDIAVDIVTAQARALCYAEFLLHVDGHLPNGLDEHISRWLEGPGIAELVAIDAEAWDCVIFALLFLVVHGALSATTVLQGLVYPLWQFALAAPDGAHGTTAQSPEVYLRAAHDIFARLLLNTACTTDGIPPTNFMDLQRVHTRRQDVFVRPHIQLLIAHIPTLVFLEHSRGVSTELGKLSGTIRQAVCEVPEFRQGVYRDLNAVRDAFESSSKLETLEESLVEHLMDALRLILNVAKADAATIGSADWLDTSALLSPWKLAATAIEVQFTLKQMGERLALGTPHVRGDTKVDRLIAKLLRHHMSKEEADFVAEMARGVGPTIVGKFVNTGLRFIANILSGADHQAPEFARAMDVVSEQLRLLAHITEPAREQGTQPPTDAATQDEFLGALAKKVEALADSGTPQPEHAILLARLVQFDLACRDIWTPSTRALSGNLCAGLFKLAMIFGSGDQLCPVAFALIMDTYYYFLDEIAADSKLSGNDIFRNYPVLQLADLPHDMPSEYREQIRMLLPYAPPNITVSNLVYASRDAAGHLILGPPAVNRPWEWVENIGDAPVSEPQDDESRRRRRPSVKNTNSIALELFGARATGEAVAQHDDPHIEADLRSLQDNISGESIFTRDWIESRIELDGASGAGASGRTRGGEDDELGALPTF